MKVIQTYKPKEKRVKVIFSLPESLAKEIKSLPRGERSRLVEENLTGVIQQMKRRAFLKKHQKLNFNIPDEDWNDQIQSFSISQSS